MVKILWSKKAVIKMKTKRNFFPFPSELMGEKIPDFKSERNYRALLKIRMYNKRFKIWVLKGSYVEFEKDVYKIGDDFKNYLNIFVPNIYYVPLH